MYFYTQYCHVYEWLYTDFGLVNWFIKHLQIVTTSNYIAKLINAPYCSLEHTLKFSQPAVSVPVVAW
jgi:hypothetical protein